MTRSAAAVKDRQFVTALSRGLLILGCFDATRPELSGSQIAKITGLPQPTVWRLCHTMLSMGVLVSVAGDRLRPGLPALRLGYSVLANLSITEAARPHMQALADRFGAACGIGARDGLDVVFVQRCESDSQLLMNLRVGSILAVRANRATNTLADNGGEARACLAASEAAAILYERDETRASRFQSLASSTLAPGPTA